VVAHGAAEQRRRARPTPTASSRIAGPFHL
jgi:hypothetical protein